MPALRLEHYNIRTLKVDATVQFYTQVLGLRTGYRPSTRPGAWLYDKTDVPVVHVSGVDPSDTKAMQELEAHLGKRDIDSLVGSGAIDHVAFEADDYDGFCAHLQSCAVPYNAREVPQLAMRQLFVTDPNGITVELNFRAPATGAAHG